MLPPYWPCPDRIAGGCAPPMGKSGSTKRCVGASASSASSRIGNRPSACWAPSSWSKMNSGARLSATWTCRPIGSGETPGTTLRQGTQPLKIWVCQRGKVQKRADTLDQNEHGDPERHSLLTAITNYRSDRGNDDRRCPGGQALNCLSAFHLHRGSLLTVRGSRDGY